MKEHVFYVAGHHSIVIYWVNEEGNTGKGVLLQDLIDLIPEIGGVYLGEL